MSGGGIGQGGISRTAVLVPLALSESNKWGENPLADISNAYYIFGTMLRVCNRRACNMILPIKIVTTEK